MGEIARSPEYLSFRSSIPQRKIIVDDDNSKEWTLYEAGPKTVKSPLICFPPASGTADDYFRQILGLSALGYRVIAVEYPIYWTMKEFVEGFRKRLDHLVLDTVHIFGASLRGFLAQKFAEHSARSPRVASLILCNAFYDTTIFQQTNSAPTFWMMPAVYLKKSVMGSFEIKTSDSDIVDSIDFMVEKLDGMSQQAIASRLTLNCMNCYVKPQKLRDVDITLMDVFDECALSASVRDVDITLMDVFDEYALSASVRDEMCKCYQEAKRAHLKNGGNFPYLSKSSDVNVFLQIHLRKYDLGPLRARELTESELSILTEADAGLAQS